MSGGQDVRSGFSHPPPRLRTEEESDSAVVRVEVSARVILAELDAEAHASRHVVFGEVAVAVVSVRVGEETAHKRVHRLALRAIAVAAGAKIDVRALDHLF